MGLQSVVTCMYERLCHHFYTVCSVIYTSIVLIINDIKRINNEEYFLSVEFYGPVWVLIVIELNSRCLWWIR